MAASATASTNQQQQFSEPCPICTTVTSTEFHRDTGKKSLKRPYLLCGRCFCIFVPRAHHITPTVEKSRYDLHNNDCADAGYQMFLSQTMRPVAMLLAHRFLSECGASSERMPFLSLSAEDDRASEKNYFLLNDKEKVLKRRMAVSRHFLPKAEEGVKADVLAAEKAIVGAALQQAQQLKQQGPSPMKGVIGGGGGGMQNNNNNNNNNNNDHDDDDGDGDEKDDLDNVFDIAEEEHTSNARPPPFAPPKFSQNQESGRSNSNQQQNSEQQKESGGGYTVLDFGCGPGPTLSKMMEEKYSNLVSTPIRLYDKFYFPNEDVWWCDGEEEEEENNSSNGEGGGVSTPQRRGRDEQQQSQQQQQQQRRPRLYDCITATEVAEHIVDAAAELTRLWHHVVRNGGILAIQTSRTEANVGFKTPPPPPPIAADDDTGHEKKQLPSQQERPAHGVDVTRFQQWHYSRDDTHVTFFHLESFRFLREKWNSEGHRVRHMFVAGPNVVIFLKD